MNPRSALQQFGLTDKEARVYLATLELGSASVAKIADKAGLPRPTCYDILASLIRQGIAASFRKKQIRYFSVDDPKRVITIAEERVKSLQEVLPQLEAVYGLARERPTVRFYQGKPGMKQIFEEILADRAEVLAFSSADDLLNCLGEYWTKFVQRRIKLKIPVRTILRDTPQARERQRLGQTELRVVKLIPPHFAHQGAIFIFGNKISFFSFSKDYLAVVVASPEITAILRSAWEFIWEQAS